MVNHTCSEKTCDWGKKGGVIKIKEKVRKELWHRGWRM